MYYEVYLDKLLLTDFVMNLFCLELVNRTLLCKVSFRRTAAGAAMGALLTLPAFFLPGPIALRCGFSFSAGAICMVWFAFRPVNLQMMAELLQKAFCFTLALGGILFFGITAFPGLRRYLTGFMGILLTGFLGYLWIRHLVGKKGEQDPIFKVILKGSEQNVEIFGLLDTGNSLKEPISGRPVCILEKEVAGQLGEEVSPESYRVIPYHSIGKSAGILNGYRLKELQVEKDGVIKVCRDVYVGIYDGRFSKENGYQIILNPDMFCAPDGGGEKPDKCRRRKYGI